MPNQAHEQGSARVIALTEGVLKAMFIHKFKMAVATILMVALFGAGASMLALQALGQNAAANEPATQRPATPASTEGLNTLAGPVISVSPDGKTVTLETPALVRGEENKRIDIRIGDKTEVTYHGVGLNAAKPTVGYRAQAWLSNADTAVRVSFAVVDLSRERRSFVSGKVVAVSDDGKRITLELPKGRDQETRKLDFTLNNETKLSYAYAAQGAAKPTVGYHAELWLGEGTRDNPVAEGTVAKVHFVDPVRENEALITGKVLALSKEGSTLTLEVAPRVRGEGPTKVDVKFTLTTEITFQGVGTDEAKLTEGYFARVWVQPGSTDTVAKAVLLKGNGRGR